MNILWNVPIDKYTFYEMGQEANKHSVKCTYRLTNILRNELTSQQIFYRMRQWVNTYFME